MLLNVTSSLREEEQDESDSTASELSAEVYDWFDDRPQSAHDLSNSIRTDQAQHVSGSPFLHATTPSQKPVTAVLTLDAAAPLVLTEGELKFHRSRGELQSSAPSNCTKIQPFDAVKDTNEVNHKRLTLPTNFRHPLPTSGNFMKKRTILNNYILLDVIGTGSYAEVRLCKEKLTDRLYAMKIINKIALRHKATLPSGISPKQHDDVGVDDKALHAPSHSDVARSKALATPCGTTLHDVEREVGIMRKLSHPHVLHLHEVMDDPRVNKIYLVLEYMKQGDLLHLLNGDANKYHCDVMTDTQLWHVFRQVACGLEYLHCLDIVHGDMKPQNLLVGDSGVVKIADFGISRILGTNFDQQCAATTGTPAFLCPELWATEKDPLPRPACDVWAFGATMYMLRFGHPPYFADRAMQLYHQIIHAPLVFPTHVRGKRLILNGMLEELLQLMLSKDPNKRATIGAILDHPWLQHAPHASVRTSSITSNRTSASIFSSATASTKSQCTVGNTSRAVWKSELTFLDTPACMAYNTASHEPSDPTSAASFSTMGIHPLSRKVRNPQRSFVGQLHAEGESTAASFTSNHLRQSSQPSSCGFRGCSSLEVGHLDNSDVASTCSAASAKSPLCVPKGQMNEYARVSAVWHSRQGHRASQEDRVTVIPDLSALTMVSKARTPQHLRSLAYAGVFDGHHGGLCATFLQHSLHQILVSQRDFQCDVGSAIVAAFRECDVKLCDVLREHRDESGSTALIAVFDGRSRRMLVAHAGDSRCVVGLNDGRAHVLTREHRVTRPDESARIMAAGGCIVNHRLNGILAVSRSFGDLAHRNAAAVCPTLTAAPEVTIRNLQPHDEFVILATDGLWDVMDSQLAVTFIRRELAAHHDMQRAAAAVTQEAIRCGSIDNVTVVLISLTY